MYMPLKEGQGEWRRGREKKLGIKEEHRNVEIEWGMRISKEGGWEYHEYMRREEGSQQGKRREIRIKEREIRGRV